MLEEPDIVEAVRAVKRRLSREAGYDLAKLDEIAREGTKGMDLVYSDLPNVYSPKAEKLFAESRARKAARRQKVDAYLAKRAARTAAAKSA